MPAAIVISLLAILLSFATFRILRPRSSVKPINVKRAPFHNGRGTNP